MSADSADGAEMEPTIARLLGQHPAALRAVRWQQAELTEGELGHLELETKHGYVVVFDHDNGNCYSNPPAPPDAVLPRRQQDLTETLPGAFNGRPVIESISRMLDGDDVSGWRFGLSTGVTLCLTLGNPSPVLSED